MVIIKSVTGEDQMREMARIYDKYAICLVSVINRYGEEFIIIGQESDIEEDVIDSEFNKYLSHKHGQVPIKM
jgi:hypothetical protein